MKLCRVFKNAQRFYDSKKNTDTDDDELNIKKNNICITNSVEGEMGVFTRHLHNLRSSTTRKCIIDDIIIKVTNNNVKFDTNPYLFAFNNKIYDLKTNSFITPNRKDLYQYYYWL